MLGEATKSRKQPLELPVNGNELELAGIRTTPRHLDTLKRYVVFRWN